jgi:hypothetical protein
MLLASPSSPSCPTLNCSDTAEEGVVVVVANVDELLPLLVIDVVLLMILWLLVATISPFPCKTTAFDVAATAVDACTTLRCAAVSPPCELLVASACEDTVATVLSLVVSASGARVT